MNSKNRESGAVSMLSVTFFMILLSVLTVSFVRVVVRETGQTRDNELSASALAAAQAGIEDAKRLLIYCENNSGDPTVKANCDAALKSIEANDCDAVLNRFGGTSSDSMIQKINDRGVDEGLVDDAGGQQRYSCLQIQRDTENVVKGLEEGASVIIPLKLKKNGSGAASNLPGLRLMWHDLNDDVTGAGGSAAGLQNSPQDLLAYGDWRSSSKPAVLRLEVVAVPHGTFTFDGLTKNYTRAVTLVPTKTSGANRNRLQGTDGITLNNYEPLETPKINNSVPQPRVDAKCDVDGMIPRTGNTPSKYACAVVFGMLGSGGAGNGFNLADFDYYLRIQAIYKSTEIELSLENDAYLFDGVQPRVDVTGRTNDVFRRIQAYVSPNDGVFACGQEGTWCPEYAIDSEAKVCKIMSVYNDSGTDNCSY